MNENEANEIEKAGFVRSVVRDDGVQRAAAGVVVALIVAGTKELIFGGKQ